MSLVLQAINCHWKPACVYFLQGLAWVCGIELAPSAHYSTSNYSSKLASLQAIHSSLYRCLRLWPKATWMRTKNSLHCSSQTWRTLLLSGFYPPGNVRVLLTRLTLEEVGEGEEVFFSFSFYLLLCFHYLRYKTYFFMKINFVLPSRKGGKDKSETKQNPTLPSLCFVQLMLFVSFLSSFCSCRGDFGASCITTNYNF